MSYSTGEQIEEDELNKIRQAFVKQKPDLVINRGMGSSITDFKEWAKVEYHDDYGSAFFFLWSLFAPSNAEILTRLDNLENEINEIKGKPVKKNKIIHLGNGKNIEVKVN